MKPSSKNVLEVILTHCGSGNRNVFGIMMISATFVTLARLFGALELHWDFSLQIEAAYRFIEGLGLTNTFSSRFNLNQPPLSESLTHYPPGLSLLIAAFLWFDIPLAIALKIIYGVTTLVGWFGWSMVAARCLPRPFRRGISLTPLYSVLAAILPIFYTPHWTNQGTDIILWAGVPLYVLLLRSFQNKFWIWPTLLSGLLLAALISFRYASGFLLPTAMLIIFYANFPKSNSILSRNFFFFTSFLAVIFPAILFFRSTSQTELQQAAFNSLQTHGARYADPDHLKVITITLQNLLSSFSNLYLLTGMDTVGRLEPLLELYPTFNILFGLSLLFLISILPLLLIRSKDEIKPPKDFRVLLLLSFLLVAFIIFSIPLAFLISYSPLAVDRYYVPIELCFILIVCGLLRTAKNKALLQRSLQLFLVAFLLFNLVGKPIYYAKSGEKFPVKAFLLHTLKVSDVDYPSNQLLPFYRDTLAFIASREDADPNSLFFVQDYPYYRGYANFENPSKFRRIPDNKFWKNAYLSKPTRIYWVIDPRECLLVCASGGNFNSDNPKVPLSFVASLPNLETVFTSPEGDAVVRISDLPAGYRFSKD